MSYVTACFADIDLAEQRIAIAQKAVREHLLHMRDLAGITQAQLGQACQSISAARICELETGRRPWSYPLARMAEDHMKPLCRFGP
jgi:hypothetical protein